MTMPPSQYVGSLYLHILNLSTEEVVWLHNKLSTLTQTREEDDDDEGGAGVREPRRPHPNPPREAAEIADA